MAFLLGLAMGEPPWRVVGTEADARALTGLEPEPVLVHVAWIAGCMVVGATLALWAARRESVTRRT